MHKILIHADTVEEVKSFIKDYGAQTCCVFPINGRWIGWIITHALSVRSALREHPTIFPLPNAQSPCDISLHAKKLGLDKAKTARDIYAAVFAMHNVDEFDPDL